MNTVADRAVSAHCKAGKVSIQFANGQVLSFPIKGNPRLEKGTPKELNTIELSPFGIHWPLLDEDLSFAGILRGEYGQATAVQSAAEKRTQNKALQELKKYYGKFPSIKI